MNLIYNKQLQKQQFIKNKKSQGRWCCW